MPDTSKRKTTTSTAVKQRYIDKTYTEFRAKLRNEVYDEIDEFIQSQGWSKADFTKIAYVILKETAKKMKIIVIHTTTYGIIGADTDCKHYFSKDDAINAAAGISAHLTDSERQNYIIYTEGYVVRLPNDYTVTTAEQLNRDLCNGDVESPDFDPCTAQYTSKQLYYNEHIAR